MVRETAAGDDGRTIFEHGALRFCTVPRKEGYGVQLWWWLDGKMDWLDHGPFYDGCNHATGDPVWFSDEAQAKRYVLQRMPPLLHEEQRDAFFHPGLLTALVDRISRIMRGSRPWTRDEVSNLVERGWNEKRIMRLTGWSQARIWREL